MFEQEIYKNLKIFSNSDTNMIQELAKGLNEDDILEAFDTNKKKLALSAEGNDDYNFFMHNFRKGRLAGKRAAVNALVNSLGNPDISLKYLKQFSTSWPDSDGAGDNGVKLRIMLDQASASSSPG